MKESKESKFEKQEKGFETPEAIWKESEPLIKDTLAGFQEALEATSEMEKLAKVKIEGEEYKIQPWVRIKEGKITRIELRSSGVLEEEVKGEKMRGFKRYEFVDDEDMKGFMYDLSFVNERGLIRQKEHGSVYYAPKEDQFLIDNPELSQSQLKKIHEAFEKKRVEFSREEK